MASKETEPSRVSEGQLHVLAEAAWAARENAYVIGPTKVGCAVLAEDEAIFTGCNVEHRFRCHDIHAEVNAITSMVAGGRGSIIALVIAAERNRFTPCGSCMDWIMQFAADGDCLIVAQSEPNGPFYRYTARELMPHYPE